MLLRRIGWHLRRVRERIDRRTALGLVGLLGGTIVVAALIVTLVEGPLTLGKFGESFYWALSLLLGSGDATFVSSGIGRLVSASLIILSVTLLALVTGLLIGFIIDVVIREGQGMGSAGMTGHVVVCGWNPSAREVIDELLADQSRKQVVLLCDVERNPADRRVYFVRGDATNEADLERAGIRDASAAIVFPDEPTDAADMRSILVVMAIESMAPAVRTVVEVSNARNGAHLKRAHADEVIATPRLAAHLIARSALYAGLADLVMDLVTGGEGSELYHVQLPSESAGQTVSQVGDTLRRTRTILVAIVRDGKSQVNPPPRLRGVGGGPGARDRRIGGVAGAGAAARLTGARPRQSGGAPEAAAFQVSMMRRSRSQPRTEMVAVDRPNIEPERPGRPSQRAARTRSMCPWPKSSASPSTSVTWHRASTRSARALTWSAVSPPGHGPVQIVQPG